MIYFATVHWKDARWIDIQLRRLNELVNAEYKVYAFLNEVDPQYRDRFDVVLDDGDPSHAVKLNKLAERIVEDSLDDSDWMIFLDGDAFPVEPVVPKVQRYLEEAPLAAVQRLENLGEKHTHPCFTCTTTGFWKQLGGDWGKGYKWINAVGMPDTDVGANLYGKLKEGGHQWKPLHRSNTQNLHPVFYGIYDNLIYHHGAGFRAWECRQTFYDAGVYELRERWDVKLINRVVPARILRHIRKTVLHPEGRLKLRVTKEKAILDGIVYDRILHEEGFPESLIA